MNTPIVNRFLRDQQRRLHAATVHSSASIDLVIS
jgi:hypothetical protein